MKTINYLYPNGGKRAVTFSYDDNHDANRRLVETFNRYGIKGTFHLNAGAFDQPEHLRSDEIAVLFTGHEIADHSTDHPFLSQQPTEAVLSQLLDDRAQLEQLAGYPVKGFSYPFGDYRADVVSMTKSAGYVYARTCSHSYDVFWPDDFMRWNPSCHHYEFDKVFSKVEEVSRWNPIALLFIWGHAFEFERNNDWDFLDEMCKKVSSIPNVWLATNIEIMDYLVALRSLRWSMDGSTVDNPSRLDILVEIDDMPIVVSPGFNKLALE